jgi:N-carbamoyl-L-amino-acid hydrolase
MMVHHHRNHRRIGAVSLSRPDRGLRVDAARLWRTLEEYARYGATAAGGVSRPVFSPPDLELRRRFIDDGRALGLDVSVDAAANVFCSRPGHERALPRILIGSHLDSVPDGGRYDGALGVICGLEVMRTLVDLDHATRHTVELVSLTGEEATPFGTSTFGSRALAGRLPDVSANTLPDGRTVRQALRDAGGDWDDLRAMPAAREPIACFLEAHIEQGTRLEAAGRALAPVSGVCGIYRHRIVFHGAAGHAGTTSMAERHDALRAAALFILAVPALPASVAAADPSATATVGYLEVVPNSPNVIPGRVTLVTDLRSADAALLAALAESAAVEARWAARDTGTEVEINTMLDQAPVAFDARVRAVLGAVLESLGEGGVGLASQAGHDAVHLGALAPAGMIFVRCRGGVSHNPAESVQAADAALAADALLRAVRAIDASSDFDTPRVPLS